MDGLRRSVAHNTSIREHATANGGTSGAPPSPILEADDRPSRGQSRALLPNVPTVGGHGDGPAGRLTSGNSSDAGALACEAPGKIDLERHKVQRAHEYLQRMRLTEQFSRSLSAGWELPRILRLALRTALVGMPRSIGAHVSLLDHPRARITILDVIGWRARRLKGKQIELADFSAARPLFSADGRLASGVAVACDSPADCPTFVGEGVHLVAVPLLVRGEVVGILGLSRSGQTTLDAEEELFLQLVGDLVASALASARLWSEVSGRTREVAVLGEVDLGAVQTFPLMRVLRVLTKAARELTRSERISISALNADGKSQTRLILSGQGARSLRKQRIPMRRGLSGWVIEHGEPAFSNDLPSDPRVDPQLIRELSLHSGAVVPLLVKGKVIGCLSVYNRPEQEPYDEHDVGVLTHLATHAAAAIENASLSDRYRRSPLAKTLIWQMLSERRCGVSYWSVVEERTRIARELHDGIAQNLSNLNFRLQLVQQMVAGAAGNEEAARELTIIRETVCGMYDAVRVGISTLESRGQWEDDFTRALAKAVGDFTGKSGMAVALDVRVASVKLPPLIGLRLLQIAEEALVNVQKHAKASRVSVALSVRDRQLDLSIVDDGRGFRPEGVPSRRGHFGLLMMRERAKEVGARLSFSAQRGQGTRVLVTLPLSPGGYVPCSP